MNLDYDDGQITCSNCDGRFYPEVGMSPCPHCSPLGKSMYSNTRDSDECTADVGPMGHKGCTNPNCSCNAPEDPVFDIYGNVEVPVYQPKKYKPMPYNQILKYRALIHETEKAMLFSIKQDKALYDIWIPKTAILELTDKKVTVSNQFYRSSVQRQMREQSDEQ